jgi:hypothetical protein
MWHIFELCARYCSRHWGCGRDQNPNHLLARAADISQGGNEWEQATNLTASERHKCHTEIKQGMLSCQAEVVNLRIKEDLGKRTFCAKALGQDQAWHVGRAVRRLMWLGQRE